MQSLSFLLKLPFLLPLKCWLPKIEALLDGVYICPSLNIKTNYLVYWRGNLVPVGILLLSLCFFCCCHISDPSLYCLSLFLRVLCHCFIAMLLGGIIPLQVLRIQLLTFKTQCPHTNSPNWSLYISLKNELREFDKRSKHFILGDHFINSHNLISWQCMGIIRRKLMLVTSGT